MTNLCEQSYIIESSAGSRGFCTKHIMDPCLKLWELQII